MIDNQEQARNAAFLIIGQMLAVLSESIIPIILVRFLSFDDVGILTTILLIYSIIAPALTSAFPATLMYFLPTRSPDQRKITVIKIVKILLLLGFLGSIFLVCLGLLAILFPIQLSNVTDQVVGGISAIGPSSLKYLLLLALLPIGDFPARILPNLLIIENRALTAAVVGIIKSIGTLIFIFIPVLLNLNLWVIVGSYTFFGFLYSGILFYYIKVLYPGTVHQQTSSAPTTRQIFSFAIPMGITETVMTLYNRVDQFLIAMVFTAALVAQYRVGAWQIPFIITIAYSVGSVYAPHLRKLLDEGRAKEAIELWRLSIKKVSLLSIPLGLVFVVGAEEVIELLFTRDYLRASNVFRLYCLLTVARVAAFGPVLVAAGQPRMILRVAVISFTANILFSVPAMFFIGLEGPALGSVLAFIIHVTAFCWYISKALDIEFKQVFPLKQFLQTLTVGLLASGCALFFKMNMVLTAGWRLAGITIILLSTFSLIGTMSGLIKKEDWQFLGRIFSPKILTQDK